MKGNNDIYVLEADGEYRVRPSVWSSPGQKGAPVRVRNATSKTVKIVVPGTLTGTGKPASVSIPAGKKAAVDLRASEVVVVDKCWVQVQLASNPDRWVDAKGESDPIIIIDPAL